MSWQPQSIMAEKTSGNNALKRLSHKKLMELTPALTEFTGTAGSAF
jgi:hypothetical protein